MPNERNVQTAYLGQAGEPDTFAETVLYKPGELGNSLEWKDRSYQLVRLDTSATSATPTGVVAANQVAYWKDQSTYTVTNSRLSEENVPDGQFAAYLGYQNNVAGIFRLAVVAGDHTYLLQRGNNIPLADGGNTFAAGESVIAEAGTAAAADRIAVGTAVTFQRLGFAQGVAAGGNVNVDVDIPSAP